MKISVCAAYTNALNIDTKLCLKKAKLIKILWYLKKPEEVNCLMWALDTVDGV